MALQRDLYNRISDGGGGEVGGGGAPGAPPPPPPLAPGTDRVKQGRNTYLVSSDNYYRQEYTHFFL